MEKRAIMKLKKPIRNLLIITVLVLSIFLILPTEGQESVYTSPTYRFEIDENTNFTVVSRAPLSWEENVGVNFSITLEAKTGEIPPGENITITYVDITYVYPDNETEARYLHAEDFMLNETIQIYHINTTLLAPNDYNLFNISIEIIAHSSLQPEDTLYIAYFPGDRSYIQVERGAALPIINLPGFPDPQTFVRWIFVFVVILLIMITPSLFVGIPKMGEFSKKAFKKLMGAISKTPKNRKEEGGKTE